MQRFQLAQHQTSVKQEFSAAIIGFVTLVYVMIINAQVLSVTGISYENGVIASILATAAGTILMGIFLNLPFQIAPAMGINAYVSYGLVSSGTLTIQESLTAVFFSGLVVALISLTPILQYLDRAISPNFKIGIRAGIGLYLIFLGLESANVIQINKNQFLKMTSFAHPTILLVLLLLVLGITLHLKKIKSNFLLIILLGSVIFYLLRLSPFPTVSFSLVQPLRDYLGFFAPLTAKGFGNPHLWSAVLSLSLTVIFETIGTVPIQLDEVKSKESINKIGFFVGISTCLAAIFGTTSTISALESEAAISSGGKTGLTNVFVGLLFLGSLLFLPIYRLVPTLATTPVLILIGINMFQSIVNIDLIEDKPDIFASVLFITMIPFTFSITSGMGIAFIAYVLIKICLGEAGKVSWANWIISALFVVMFFIQALAS